METTYKSNPESGFGVYTRASRRETVDPRSAIDLIKDVVDNLQGMIRGELRLARAETAEKVAHTVRGAAFILAGALLGLYAFAFLLVFGHDLLSDLVSPAVSAAIFAVALGIVAFALVTRGRRKMKSLSPLPRRTVESLRQDLEVIREHTF